MKKLLILSTVAYGFILSAIDTNKEDLSLNSNLPASNITINSPLELPTKEEQIKITTDLGLAHFIEKTNFFKQIKDNMSALDIWKTIKDAQLIYDKDADNNQRSEALNMTIPLLLHAIVKDDDLTIQAITESDVDFYLKITYLSMVGMHITLSHLTNHYK